MDSRVMASMRHLAIHGALSEAEDGNMDRAERLIELAKNPDEIQRVLAGEVEEAQSSDRPTQSRRGGESLENENDSDDDGGDDAYGPARMARKKADKPEEGKPEGEGGKPDLKEGKPRSKSGPKPKTPEGEHKDESRAALAWKTIKRVASYEDVGHDELEALKGHLGHMTPDDLSSARLHLHATQRHADFRPMEKPSFGGKTRFADRVQALRDYVGRMQDRLKAPSPDTGKVAESAGEQKGATATQAASPYWKDSQTPIAYRSLVGDGIDKHLQGTKLAYTLRKLQADFAGDSKFHAMIGDALAGNTQLLGKIGKILSHREVNHKAAGWHDWANLHDQIQQDKAVRQHLQSTGKFASLEDAAKHASNADMQVAHTGAVLTKEQISESVRRLEALQRQQQEMKGLGAAPSTAAEGQRVKGKLATKAYRRQTRAGSYERLFLDTPVHDARRYLRGEGSPEKAQHFLRGYFEFLGDAAEVGCEAEMIKRLDDCLASPRVRRYAKKGIVARVGDAIGSAGQFLAEGGRRAAQLPGIAARGVAQAGQAIGRAAAANPGLAGSVAGGAIAAATGLPVGPGVIAGALTGRAASKVLPRATGVVPKAALGKIGRVAATAAGAIAGGAVGALPGAIAGGMLAHRLTSPGEDPSKKPGKPGPATGPLSLVGEQDATRSGDRGETGTAGTHLQTSAAGGGSGKLSPLKRKPTFVPRGEQEPVDPHADSVPGSRRIAGGNGLVVNPAGPPQDRDTPPPDHDVDSHHPGSHPGSQPGSQPGGQVADPPAAEEQANDSGPREVPEGGWQKEHWRGRGAVHPADAPGNWNLDLDHDTISASRDRILDHYAMDHDERQSYSHPFKNDSTRDAFESFIRMNHPAFHHLDSSDRDSEPITLSHVQDMMNHFYPSENDKQPLGPNDRIEDIDDGYDEVTPYSRKACDPKHALKCIRNSVTPIEQPTHSYAAAEALYHLLGGSGSGAEIHRVRAGDKVHWFVRHNGEELHPNSASRGLPGSGPASFVASDKPSSKAQKIIKRAKTMMQRRGRSKKYATMISPSQALGMAIGSTTGPGGKLKAPSAARRKKIESVLTELNPQGHPTEWTPSGSVGLVRSLNTAHGDPLGRIDSSAASVSTNNPAMLSVVRPKLEEASPDTLKEKPFEKAYGIKKGDTTRIDTDNVGLMLHDLHRVPMGNKAIEDYAARRGLTGDEVDHLKIAHAIIGMGDEVTHQLQRGLNTSGVNWYARDLQRLDGMLIAVNGTPSYDSAGNITHWSGRFGTVTKDGLVTERTPHLRLFKVAMAPLSYGSNPKINFGAAIRMYNLAVQKAARESVRLGRDVSPFEVFPLHSGRPMQLKESFVNRIAKKRGITDPIEKAKLAEVLRSGLDPAVTYNSWEEASDRDMVEHAYKPNKRQSRTYKWKRDASGQLVNEMGMRSLEEDGPKEFGPLVKEHIYEYKKFPGREDAYSRAFNRMGRLFKYYRDEAARRGEPESAEEIERKVMDFYFGGAQFNQLVALRAHGQAGIDFQDPPADEKQRLQLTKAFKDMHDFIPRRPGVDYPTRGWRAVRALELHPGVYTLGPKGGAFALNINHLVDAITKDMWFSRSWNRLMGTLYDPTKKKKKSDDDEEKSSLFDTPRSEHERYLMDAAVHAVSKHLGLQPAEFQAAWWYYEQGLYQLMSAKAESFSFSDAVNEWAENLDHLSPREQQEKRRELEQLAVPNNQLLETKGSPSEAEHARARRVAYEWAKVARPGVRPGEVDKKSRRGTPVRMSRRTVDPLYGDVPADFRDRLANHVGTFQGLRAEAEELIRQGRMPSLQQFLAAIHRVGKAIYRKRRYSRWSVKEIAQGIVRKYSQNKDVGSFIEALQSLRSRNQKAHREIARQVLAELRLEPSKHLDAVHDMQQVAKPALVQKILNPDSADQASYAAAWYGLLAEQPGLMVFHYHPDGPDRVYRFNTVGKAESVRNALDQMGFPQRLITPTSDGFEVHVFDAGGQRRDALGNLAAGSGVTIEETPGHGQFVGSPAGDHGQARDVYRKTIQAYETQNPKS